MYLGLGIKDYTIKDAQTMLAAHPHVEKSIDGDPNALTKCDAT